MIQENIKIDDNQNLELLEEKFEEEEEERRPELDIPPKDRKLITHPYDFIIRSLKDQVDDETLVLADKFQRRRVWDDTKASRLIESLLLNVPIPVCYFAELEHERYSVIDGQQRLTAIYRFLNNEFALRGLKVRTELNRKRFHEIDVTDKRLINSRAIRCIVILKESHPDIKFDVFERLNTGSVRLNSQELRNSIYRGNLTDLIRELSQYEYFLKARNISILNRNLEDCVDKRMQDCELILRFFAFYFRLNEYRGYLATFLDEYLKSGIKFDTQKLEQHKQLFERVINDVYFVFDQHAFRRYTSDNRWEKAINRSIYDIIMLSFANLDSHLIRSKKPEILKAFQLLCQDPVFQAAITSGTTYTDRIQTRLDKWRDELSILGLSVPYLKVGQKP
ncbi:DUF262 domain-containing protein [Sphaerospermopsis aphanizomenoides BCCUSP55]|uniref:DUF262 domain-containing protein n=1 Tax=Sphaerospermopsis aphanizomenoides TaxID=459663 RepID=UPI0019051F87|nr:DUF262 domain-containing protein [Sphaerospermopsis aphanizomenoides]MBK1986223.1 DUF262 domain-containing protein [Sphaerospermopsis aphanizomenoides BCCUSP55]